MFFELFDFFLNFISIGESFLPDVMSSTIEEIISTLISSNFLEDSYGLCLVFFRFMCFTLLRFNVFYYFIST